MKKIEISVRSLVEFILRSGDINRKKRAAPENAMLEGGRIHRMIQRKMGSDYKAEVPLAHKVSYDSFEIVVQGRADGIIDNSEGVTVDEIKGIYINLKYLDEPINVHLAQAKVYAAIYALQNDLENIAVRMTYCNLDTEEIKYFNYSFIVSELKEWFGNLMDEYARWARFTVEWEEKRNLSIKQLEFPFTYRKGQKELAAAVYRTIYHKRRLFLEAPTGVGKTLSVLFPAVKAMGEGIAEKIFYLTAKTITGTVALDTFELLSKGGLAMKTVSIAAREKTCLLDEVKCDPEVCPYAKGHFDRINDALFEILHSKDSFTREEVMTFAKEHRVCPFELTLDISSFSDAVVCDYNYCFDPDVSLKRFFGDMQRHDYLFLVDEAHNLVERARETYSAELYKEDFLKVKRLLQEKEPKAARALGKCNEKLLEMKKSGGDFEVGTNIDKFLESLRRAASTYSDMLEEKNRRHETVEDELMEFYYNVRSFLNIAEIFDENYVDYTEITNDGKYRVKLFCVNPSTNLRRRLDLGRSSIFFSATLLPVRYYMDLISGDRTDYTVYAASTFEASKRGVYIASDVSSKYTRRSRSEYRAIAEYILNIISAKKGKYMAFFPSYSFMNEVLNIFTDDLELDGVDHIVQDNNMSEESRKDFLEKFTKEDIKDSVLVGFCVLGGVFSEGIDLKNDSLIGAIIVGTGFPMVCREREILKRYFEENGENGFDYAYRYPGMNKVLQAAGRVIRTEEDIGVVALLDERFLENNYSGLFPREWENMIVVQKDTVKNETEKFWSSRLNS